MVARAVKCRKIGLPVIQFRELAHVRCKSLPDTKEWRVKAKRNVELS